MIVDLTDKRKVVLIVVVAVVIVAAIVVFVTVVQRGGTPSGIIPAGPGVLPPSLSATHLPVPAGVVVPDKGASNPSSSLAVPQVEVSAAPGADTKLRIFDITVQNGQFTPNAFAVNVGDTMTMYVTAVDGNYDFTQPDFGFVTPLPKGKRALIQFAPMTTGKFIFYCTACGGPSKGPTGYFIVK